MIVKEIEGKLQFFTACYTNYIVNILRDKHIYYTEMVITFSEISIVKIKIGKQKF